MAVMNVTYMSDTLKRYVDFKVILPIEHTGNKKAPNRKNKLFKTIYLLHGYTGSSSDWLYESRIFKLARDKNMAVVMPSGENSFYMDYDKEGLMYSTYIGKELVEATRKMFPLSKKSEDTFIAGLSMGGYGSLLIGSKFPYTFGAIACLSGGFLIDDVVNDTISKELIDSNVYKNLFERFVNIKESMNDPIFVALQALSKGCLPPIYLACGTEDILFDCNMETKEKLSQAGAEVTWVQGKGGHEWSFWNLYIEQVIDWFLSRY